MYQPTGPGSWSRPQQRFSSTAEGMAQYGQGHAPMPPYGQKPGMYGYQGDPKQHGMMKPMDAASHASMRQRSPWESTVPGQYSSYDPSKMYPDFQNSRTEFSSGYHNVDSINASRGLAGSGVIPDSSAQRIRHSMVPGDQMYAGDYGGMRKPGPHYNYQPTAPQQNPAPYSQYHLPQSHMSAASLTRPVQPSHLQMQRYHTPGMVSNTAYMSHPKHYPSQSTDPTMGFPMNVSTPRPVSAAQTPPRTTPSYNARYGSGDGNVSYGQMAPRMGSPSAMHMGAPSSSSRMASPPGMHLAPPSSTSMTVNPGAKADSFSLDSLLDDTGISTGSFMQQLEDIAPKPMASPLGSNVSPYPYNAGNAPVMGSPSRSNMLSPYPRNIEGPRMRRPSGQQSAHAPPPPVHAGPQPILAGQQPVLAGQQSVHTAQQPVHGGQQPVPVGQQSLHGGQPVLAGQQPAGPGHMYGVRHERMSVAGQEPPKNYPPAMMSPPAVQLGSPVHTPASQSPGYHQGNHNILTSPHHGYPSGGVTPMPNQQRSPRPMSRSAEYMQYTGPSIAQHPGHANRNAQYRPALVQNHEPHQIPPDISRSQRNVVTNRVDAPPQQASGTRKQPYQNFQQSEPPLQRSSEKNIPMVVPTRKVSQDRPSSLEQNLPDSSKPGSNVSATSLTEPTPQNAFPESVPMVANTPMKERLVSSEPSAENIKQAEPQPPQVEMKASEESGPTVVTPMKCQPEKIDNSSKTSENSSFKGETENVATDSDKTEVQKNTDSVNTVEETVEKVNNVVPASDLANSDKAMAHHTLPATSATPSNSTIMNNSTSEAVSKEQPLGKVPQTSDTAMIKANPPNEDIRPSFGYPSANFRPGVAPPVHGATRPPVAGYPSMQNTVPPPMRGQSPSMHPNLHPPPASPQIQRVRLGSEQHQLPPQGPPGTMHRPGYSHMPMSQRFPRQPGAVSYPERHPMPMHGPANRYPPGFTPRPGYVARPGAYGYHDTSTRHQLFENGGHPRPYYKPPEQGFGMQPQGGMLPQGPQHRPPFHGPVNAYPPTLDGRPGPGWHDPRQTISGPDQIHPSLVPPIPAKDPTKSEKTAKKVKASKDVDGAPKAKKERVKKGGDKNENSTKSGASDSSGEKAAKAAQSAERKRKKPPATFKMKKKKRKKGEDTDDFDGLLPEVDESLIEKRRSARNVKRKQYTENLDYQLSGDESGEEAEGNYSIKTKDITVEMNKDADVMIVEKILDMRVRKVKIEKPEEGEKEEEAIKEDADDKDSDEGKKNDNNDTKVSQKPQETSSKTEDDAEYEEIEEYFVKYKNYSYLHCEWKSKDEFEDKRVDGKIKRYKTKMASMPEYLKAEISEPFNPDYVEVERVLDVTQDEDDPSAEKHYFVKWCSLAYEDCTWEAASDVPPDKIQEFERRCKYMPSDFQPEVPDKKMFRKLGTADGRFLNNNQLRDYQLEGINWLLFNWYNRRNCILADEMGLGKTVQSITFLQKVFDHGIEGPFLIVAPLSTICNWQREFASWTNMNAVIYHGSQTSRDMIRTYEFLCRDENLEEIPGKYKMHAVITTYEMIVLESSHLVDIEWKCSIIDEAHRLKNQSCKLADALRSMHLDYKVLLTGTPLQNNVEELFALLNFLQPEVFSSSSAFIAEFGDMKNTSQVEKIQELLKPMMLRRLKEDVEKSLAPKEETIIEVELTAIQKKYYRAILERNFEFLSKGTATGNVPNLMNTMMELRKCCNHPYLIKGAEDKIMAEQQDNVDSQLKLMIQSSGKLVLIDKLLPRLKSAGHKVLIFSQMVRCLDILEDYMVQSQYSYERIDGGIRGSDRQAAIDRFSKPDSEKFVFLLCTRAGGLGINLTAADTVIIFDSDWNPQNDLQAQARCHRIGQRKMVKIYRLITRNSYEREMFEKASLKLGLDKAILQSMSGRVDEVNQNNQPSLSKQEVEDLLKLGAYGAIMDEEDDSNKFCEEDIDQILLRRTQTIKIAPGQKGSTFSKASFVSEEKEGAEISLNDPDFWEKWAKKADLDIDRLKNNKLIIEQPRRRKQTRRFGGHTQDVEVLAEIGSDSDSDYDEKVQSRRQKRKSKNKNWAKRDFFRVERHLLTFGWGRWKYMQDKGAMPSQMKLKDVETVCRAMVMYCLKFYNGDEKVKAFIWDLITPVNCPSVAATVNAEGMSVSPSPRSRKGRSKQEDPSKSYDMIAEQWIHEVDVNALLHEDGFKKHLQNHSNKIILRLKMLHFLKTEILGVPGDDGESKTEVEDIAMPDISFEKFVDGWDYECDKNLLIGIHKHGFGKYSIIRADPKLCFLKKYGMPDEKSLSDDLDDFADDDNKDPEYKPAKLNLSEYSEFEQDSPATAPSSPASTDSAAPSKTDTKDEDEEEKTKEGDSVEDSSQNESANEKNEDAQDEKPTEAPVSNEETDSLKWPTVAELNMRTRRLVSRFQKQQKQMRSRLMGIDQNPGKAKIRESPREKIHWTRREESDFYRTISTFGVEYQKQSISWTRFRQLAKLEKKSDRNLEMYFLAFKAMCERACGHKVPLPDEIANISVMRITEERATRTLYRIELLNRVRLDVLKHKKLDERLKLCEPSMDLPAWWEPGRHDKELLIGMDRHGVTRTEVHILNDSSLSFLKSMMDYEQVQAMKLSRKQTASSEVQETSNKKTEEKKEGEEESTTPSESSEEKPVDSLKIPPPMSKEESARLLNEMYNSLKWPKDRILIQRVEQVCYCVLQGRWPVSRMQEEAAFHKQATFTMPAISPSLLKTLPKGASPLSSGNQVKLLLDADGRALDEASSQLLKMIAAHGEVNEEARNFYKSKSKVMQPSSMSSQKIPSSRSKDDAQYRLKEESEALANLLANSKINETLQLLMKGDLPQRDLAEKILLSQFEQVPGFPLPKQEITHPVSKPEKTSSSQSQQRPHPLPMSESKVKDTKLPLKKKPPKSKTGFISPAVLPPESRIPVYNPTEKKKLIGDDAPLNKDLADWLKAHPGFVVDYKTLRQNLNKESEKASTPRPDPTPPPAPEPKPSTSSVKHTSKSIREQSKTPEQRPSSRDRSQDRQSSSETKMKSFSAQDMMQPFDNQSLQAMIAQSLMNPQPGLLNAMYGGSPEMNALLASGLMPGMPPFMDMFKDPAFLQAAAASSSLSSSSSRSSHSKSKGQSHSQSPMMNPQMPDLASLLALGNMQNPADLAMLSQIFSGYGNPPAGSEEEMRNHMKRLLEKSSSSLPMDPKALPMMGLDAASFFPGMPGMVNPLLYGMYGAPELAAMPDLLQQMHMTSLLENEYAKLSKENNLGAMQDLLNAQNTLMAGLNFNLNNLNNEELQKIMRSQEAMQPSMASLAKSSSSQIAGFDDNLKAVYQQLHSSSLQKEFSESKKDKDNNPDTDKKVGSSSEGDIAVDLRSQLQKKS